MLLFKRHMRLFKRNNHRSLHQLFRGIKMSPFVWIGKDNFLVRFPKSISKFANLGEKLRVENHLSSVSDS